MVYLIDSIVVFIATFLGACAGLGGGVIIKPLLDFIGLHDLSTISILSSCAVFTMAIYSTYKQIKNKVKLDYSIILLIAIGAIMGGYIGNTIFNYFLSIFDSNLVNIIQAIALIILLIIVLLNINLKHKTLNIKNKLVVLIIGLCLGLISSFLSIGGGPINVAVFTFFFSFDIKTSTIYSIATILFSQLSNLITITLNNGFSNFDFTLLLFILPMAILGGYVGVKVNRKASDNTIRTIFNITILFIIGINIYNVVNMLNLL